MIVILSRQLFGGDELRRNLISQRKFVTKIDEFAWSEEFLNSLKKFYVEDPEISFYEVFKSGINIGKCGLTSRYLVNFFAKDKQTYGVPKLHFGYLMPMKGTKLCDDGYHAWVEVEKKGHNTVYDTSLMVSFDEKFKKLFGYITKSIVLLPNAAILSEYDTYEYVYKEYKESKP